MSKKCVFPFLILFLAFWGTYVLAAGIEEGLILHFPFDDGSGDVAKDASGTGNDGEIDGAKRVDNGKIGKALQFDGKSFVEVESSDSLEALDETVTLAAWIKPELTGSGWQGIITKGNDGAEHFELLINVNGTVHTAWVFDIGRNHTNPGAAGTMTAGEWQHLAVTYEPGEWITYLNGEELNNKTDVSGQMVPDGMPLVVGDERPQNRLFEGLIDEVVVFNRVLSQKEVQQIMNGISTSVEPTDKLATTWSDIKAASD